MKMFVERLLLFLVLVSFVSGHNNINNTIFENLRKLSSPEGLARKLQEHLIRQDVGFTEECSKQLAEYGGSLGKFQPWAIQMFDSASKIPVGILFGSSGDLGVFDECMKIKTETGAGTINGKYCLGKIRIGTEAPETSYTEKLDFQRGPLGKIINGLGIKLATCLPHACTSSDIQKFYSLFGVTYEISDIACQSEASKPELDGLAIFAIVFFGIIACLMVISTIYDVYNYYYKRKPLHKLLIAYSVFTNGQKLFSTNYGPSQLTCLNGVRAFTMAGIVLTHRFKITSTLAMVINRRYLQEWIHKYSSAYLMGNTILVDSFLLMSGMVITYSFTNSMARGGKFNILRHYYHRYLRLTPPVAAVILVAVSLLKHLGNGPQWPIMIQENFEADCRKYWWSGLLYVQNYVNPSEMCLGQTWYLSVDTQLFLLSPFLLIIFHKWPKLRLYGLGALTVCLPIIPFLISWFGEYRLILDDDPVRFRNYISKLYYPTHTRATPWFIGFASGYIVYETKKRKCTISLRGMARKLAFVAYWIITILVLYSCMVLCFYIPVRTEYNNVTYSLDAALIGPIWSLALACIITPCVNGYGGIINWVLSNPFMQVLSKLSYSMYLVHNMVLYRKIHNQRTNLQFEDFEMLYLFWSDFMYTAILAIFWVLAFEYPIVVIEQFVWPHKTKRAPAKSLEENGPSTTKEAP